MHPNVRSLNIANCHYRVLPNAGKKLWRLKLIDDIPGYGFRSDSSRWVESMMGFGFLGIGALYEVDHFVLKLICRILCFRCLGIPKRIKSSVRRA